ncbi:hypothetical protein KI387_004211, partial [Taxus chinensis]
DHLPAGRVPSVKKVIEGARRPWIRICQDIISNGKHGSKAQCLKQASATLNEAKRTTHEGGLQGGKAAAVINSMLKNKEVPTLTEGFSRIMYCQTETDVENSINLYKELGPADDLPSGIHAQKRKDDKVQS